MCGSSYIRLRERLLFITLANENEFQREQYKIYRGEVLSSAQSSCITHKAFPRNKWRMVQLGVLFYAADRIRGWGSKKGRKLRFEAGKIYSIVKMGDERAGVFGKHDCSREMKKGRERIRMCARLRRVCRVCERYLSLAFAGIFTCS